MIVKISYTVNICQKSALLNIPASSLVKYDTNGVLLTDSVSFQRSDIINKPKPHLYCRFLF